MRYIRRFIKGDDITANDYAEPILDVVGPIPDPTEFHKSSRELDDLPIRVRTRYRSRTPGRRVVSAPTFDLITPMHDLDYFKEPPKINYQNIQLTDPKLNPHRVLPPLPEKRSLNMTKHRSLPPLPELSESNIIPNVKSSYIRKKPVRQVSMPPASIPKMKQESLLPISEKNHGSSVSVDTSYTGIIQSYTEFSPLNYTLDPSCSNDSTPSIVSDTGSSIYSGISAKMGSSSDATSESESESNEIVNHVSADALFKKSVVDDIIGPHETLKNSTIILNHSRSVLSDRDYLPLTMEKTRSIQRTPHH